MTDPLDPLEHPPPPVTSSDDASLRLAGFGLTALGALLIGVGALLPWVRSSLAGLPDAFSPTYYGIDLIEGVLALVAGILALVTLAVTRIATSPRARRAAAGVVVALGIVAAAVAGVALVTASDRFEAAAVDDILADLDPAGTATAEQRGEVEDLVEIRFANGPFMVLGGGVLTAVGGVLLVSWAKREAAVAEMPAAPSAEEPEA